MRQLAATKAGELGELLTTNGLDGEPIELTADDGPVAVVLSVGEYLGMRHTEALLATNGALSSIAEGLADLGAGRADSWTRLRDEYGRPELAPADEEPTVLPPAVSHRARWDLELLPPTVAEHCFKLLDGLVSRASLDVGHLLTAGFPDLRLTVADGYRMVYRVAGPIVEIVHIDAP